MLSVITPVVPRNAAHIIGSGNVVSPLTLGSFLNEVPPTILTTSLPNGVVNEAYSFQLQAVGEDPITWTISAGVLPSGWTLSSSGLITGLAPGTSNTFYFDVKAENAYGEDTQSLSLLIASSADGTLILHRRSSAPSKVPLTSDLMYGELAINTYDGTLFLKKSSGGPTVIKIGPTTSTSLDLIDSGNYFSSNVLENALQEVGSDLVALEQDIDDVESDLNTLGSTVAGLITTVNGKVTNPMTTQGDLIIGGSGGVPTRLARGSNGQYLVVSGSTLAWNTLPSTVETFLELSDVPSSYNTFNNAWVTVNGAATGLEFNTRTAGNVPVVDSGNYFTGTNVESVLSEVGLALQGVFTNPMTTAGDLIVGTSGGAATRLAVGSNNHVLTVQGGSPTWAAVPQPAVTSNQLVYGSGTGIQSSSKLIWSNSNEELTVQGSLILTNNSKFFASNFQDGTVENRFRFRANASNANSNIMASPVGSGTESSYTTTNNSTMTNAGFTEIRTTTSQSQLVAGRFGSGTYLPLAIRVNNTTPLLINTNGSWNINGAGVGSAGQVLSSNGGAAPSWSTLAASNVSYSAGGGISATNVQTAISELDTEKAPKAAATFTGGVTVSHSGTAITNALAFTSNNTGGGTNGYTNYLINGSGATVISAAIVMPSSSSGNVGTIIQYDSNDYTVYDRANNQFQVIINGNVGLAVSETNAGASNFLALNTVRFGAEYDNGNSGTSKTINFANGQKQKMTMTGNCTLTLSAPTGAADYKLKLIQNGTGGFTVTWPGGTKFFGGVAPTISTAASSVTIISVYYDGSVYWVAGGGFA